MHPDVEYALVATPRGHLLLAQDLVAACLARYGLAGDVVATTRGRALERIAFRHPFYDRASPIYLGEYVTLEQGTGIVHSSPAYGIEDFLSCRRYGMTDDDMLNPVQGDGRFADDLPFFGGLRIWDANPRIVDKLQGRACAVPRREVHAQLHALLAAQDADHLSRDDAMVRRHGRRAGIPRHEARRAAACHGAARHRRDAVLSRHGARRGCTG